MDKQQVIDLMRKSNSEEAWNANCDKVKEAFGGYPSWWYETIILGGVYNESKKNWS